MLSSKVIIIYNFEVILNIEAVVLQSFNQIFNMVGTYFSEFLAIPKQN
jgi:hypothetical protein